MRSLTDEDFEEFVPARTEQRSGSRPPQNRVFGIVGITLSAGPEPDPTTAVLICRDKVHGVSCRGQVETILVSWDWTLKGS